MGRGRSWVVAAVAGLLVGAGAAAPAWAAPAAQPAAAAVAWIRTGFAGLPEATNCLT
jgi:hypothetical protein